ncbi:MAG: preprotein translocase subunit SecE [Elusimicrobiaceae bacterium]|nr:preprotein translocase subunit SecE [Elusimicrobiaceae bacterium]
MKEKKQGLFSKIKNFFIDSKIELKKIVWPTQKTVWKNTGIVLAMIFIMGVFVALLDAGLIELLRMVMTVSNTK